MRHYFIFLISCILLCLGGSGSAQGINRCVQNGKTIFTDKPCSDPMQIPEGSAPPPGVVPAPSTQSDFSSYKTPYGEWRGQTQFQMTSKGKRVADAHSVVPMTIAIDQQGKVVGASPQNGCRILGVASPGPMATILTLDVSFSGCEYALYNRRFSGTLALYVRDKSTQLSLQSFAPMLTEQFDIKATMRR